MNVWKVILAALVIFAAGVVTGGLTVRLKVREAPPASNAVTSGISRQRGELLDRMQRQLYLSPTQRERIAAILHENHGKMKQLWESIAPQAQEEYRRANELIRAELESEQQKKFDEMLKRSPNRFLGFREDRRDPKTSRKTESGNRSPAQGKEIEKQEKR